MYFLNEQKKNLILLQGSSHVMYYINKTSIVSHIYSSAIKEEYC